MNNPDSGGRFLPAPFVIWDFHSRRFHPMSLNNNEVFVIYEDTRQQVWFGTSQGGLNVLRENTDPTKGQEYCFESFTELDGLSDNEVNAILEDGSGYLWIATNKGLSKFNAKRGEFVNYTTYDGVLKGKFRKISGKSNQLIKRRLHLRLYRSQDFCIGCFFGGNWPNMNVR